MRASFISSDIILPVTDGSFTAGLLRHIALNTEAPLWTFFAYEMRNFALHRMCYLLAFAFMIDIW